MAVSVGPWLATKAALEVARQAPGRFQYLRWLGSPRHQELNAGLVAERDDDLEQWAKRILELLPGKPAVYAYFNNDYQGHSPESARRLQSLVGVEPADPDRLQEQPDLFG